MNAAAAGLKHSIIMEHEEEASESVQASVKVDAPQIVAELVESIEDS